MDKKNVLEFLAENCFLGVSDTLEKNPTKIDFFVQRIKLLGQLERTANLCNSDTTHIVRSNTFIRNLLKSIKMHSKPSLTQKFEKNCVRLQPLI